MQRILGSLKVRVKMIRERRGVGMIVIAGDELVAGRRVVVPAIEHALFEKLNRWAPTIGWNAHHVPHGFFCREVKRTVADTLPPPCFWRRLIFASAGDDVCYVVE